MDITDFVAFLAIASRVSRLRVGIRVLAAGRDGNDVVNSERIGSNRIPANAADTSTALVNHPSVYWFLELRLHASAAHAIKAPLLDVLRIRSRLDVVRIENPTQHHRQWSAGRYLSDSVHLPRQQAE